MSKISRREFFKKALKKTVKGAGIASVGVGIGAGALKLVERRKAIINARISFFKNKMSKMPEEWAKLEIPAKKLENLKLNSNVIVSVESKAAELGMKENCVLRVLETIKYNAFDKRELQAWHNALNSSSKPVAERAKRIFNIVNWFNELQESEKREIIMLLNFIPEKPKL